ncbi:MAG: hypothetical protein Q4F72_12130, partial [Desulfovibrionaceae bacterium]|nr:hypothetical protein [Desulfovibrionaceae bacterium]
ASTASVASLAMVASSASANSLKADIPSQAAISLATRFGSVLNSAMLALLVIPDLPAEDADGSILTYALAEESDLVTMAADGTLSLTEAGITALAEAAGEGESLALSLALTVSDGTASSETTLDLTLDTEGVSVIDTESLAWGYGTDEADLMAASDILDAAQAAGTAETGTEEESDDEDEDGAEVRPVTLYGGAGDDTLVGGDGDDTLYGGEGNDFLDGGAGSDSLCGGEGHDILVWDAADAVLDGGAGMDLLVSADAGMPSLADLLDGASDAAPKVSGIEMLLRGDALADVSSRQDVLDLLARSNASIDEETGAVTLGEGWTSAGQNTGSGGTMTEVWQYAGDGRPLVLETLAPQADEAGEVQAAVLVLNTTAV